MNIAETKMESGLTFQQVMLLNALRRQAVSGMLMTNPRVTGFTSFAKAVLAFINDNKAPKTCKNLYKYLESQGWYDIKGRDKLVMTDIISNRIRLI